MKQTSTRIKLWYELKSIEGKTDDWSGQRFTRPGRAPGAVVSKRALLRRVWGPGENDEHVVEVTMARLRQRLGVAGAGIETVSGGATG